LILVTNTDNKLYRKLKKKSGPNIKWFLNISRLETKKLYANAKAVLFPPEEDFGLVPLEAMASGTPVIAYGKGGARETVIQERPFLSPTGMFFTEQTPESLNQTIEEFETKEFDYQQIREYAYNFDVSTFKQNLVEFIESKIEK
ncbi:MAG: glycosyltransferase, partial [Candidatus Gracilibacteria bacterium]|nr:glycosyltransferase [Candidatus Gracilibacteria bacterium]